MDAEKTMSEQTRRMMLVIVNNDEANLHAVTQALYFLYVHMPAAKLEASLNWLVKNKLIGKRFIDFLAECSQSEEKNSYLELHRRLLKEIEKVDGFKHVLAGRDFA